MIFQNFCLPLLKILLLTKYLHWGKPPPSHNVKKRPATSSVTDVPILHVQISLPTKKLNQVQNLGGLYLGLDQAIPFINFTISQTVFDIILKKELSISNTNI